MADMEIRPARVGPQGGLARAVAERHGRAGRAGRGGALPGSIAVSGPASCHSRPVGIAGGGACFSFSSPFGYRA